MFKITSVSDIAGRISANSLNADHVTVGCVYLPSGALRSIRKMIPKPLPKWRDAQVQDLEFIFTLIVRESLAVSVGSMNKDTPEWTQFWRDATDTHRAVSSREREDRLVF
jgi:hypothetical protein